MTWKIIKIEEGSEGKHLKEGWEPFAAVTEHGSYHYLDTTINKERTQLTNRTFVFLRKEVAHQGEQ